MTLEEEYTKRFETVLVPLSIKLEELLRDYFSEAVRIDRISTRAKSVSRFIDKAKKDEGGKPKYSNPMSQIQDQIGARIITFYLSDVDNIAEMVTKYFSPIEEKIHISENESEFGYVGKHFILFTPSDIFDEKIKKQDAPKFFELQIKTLFQHAWSEANHDLGYKPDVSLTGHQKRRMAFTAAQAWGADHIFDELFKEIKTKD
jgi:putative GTP pyrophosphokinase